MARLSTADKWPPEIRELVGKLRGQGATIDAIREKLAELDIEVPRSTLGREIKELDEVIREIRQSREIAEAIGTRIDAGSASSIARGNVELLNAMTMKMLFASRVDGQVALTSKEAKEYSEVLRNLATASKVDLDREMKVREEVRREMAEAMVKAVEEEAKVSRGLSAETVGALKARFLGMKAA